ncbi:MAG: FecR domain-containing protein, partial [Acidobacteriaceae bacterium]|nr:FecR domain-containing protein [Acidobacteriaceae bacterium]
MKTLRCLITSFAVLFFIFIAVAAFAVENDPPSRVARLKYIAGQVSIQPGGVDDWVAAAINRPLTTADRVWTDRDSRAELNLGSSAMRMSSETSLTLSNLTDGTVQVELNQGTLNLRVGRLFRGEIYEVDTPNLAFTILKAGNYRFDVDADGDQTFVTVWNGEGEATGNGSAVRVRSHERARVEHGNSLAHQVNGSPRLDGFDDWCLVRDKREESVLSSRYVSPDVIGYEDLDEYGAWRVLPTYGPVWVPAAVAPGWAPYRFGHWVWISPWGWTWVDDAAWGFAPFHYGRWVYYDGFWGWCPGPRGYRSVYAPALVAWFGGPRFGVGFSFGGGVGWFPLGWGEPFYPYYRVSRGYFRNVNVTNTRIVNITNITNNYYNNGTSITRIKYVNQNVPGAITVVPARMLTNAEPVAPRAINVPQEQLRTASVVQVPQVTPTAHSVLGVHAGTPANT